MLNLGQLVGRILRQPHAQKTGVAALDECYVVTHHADTAAVVLAIKSGLEEDGLGDLVREIRIPDPDLDGGSGKGPRRIERRPAFAKTDIYLPEVLRVEDGAVRKLDYEQDILFALDWSGVDPEPLVAKIPDNFTATERQMRRIRLVDAGQERILAEVTGETGERLAFDPAYAVRMVSDIVPNAWIAREIIGGLVAGLQRRGFADETLGKLHGLLIEELRKWLAGERDRMAEAHFRQEVAAGRIQFRLRTDQHHWTMPADSVTYEPQGADQMLGADGGPLQRSLFAPLYKNDLNQEEREVAVYLDAEQSLIWWHRNVARHQYVLQGWRRERIYPDFLFAVRPGNPYDKGNRLVVMETKGDHLQGNADTEYKRAVLDLMTQAFQIDQTQRVGELSIVNPDGTRVECDLVLMKEWKVKLPKKFQT
jgi:type III restriction enzyme